MTDAKQIGVPPFACSTTANGICEITLLGDLAPSLADGIVHHMQALIAHDGLPQGLLLDLRTTPSISLVRLSGLLTMLGHLHLPVAVVLDAQPDQQVAGLLHLTLPNRQHVAYFTTRLGAMRFLATSRARQQRAHVQ